MNEWQFFRLKNGILIANLSSNLMGYLIPQVITGVWTPLPDEMRSQVDLINIYFTPCAFLIGFLLTLAYERPLRKYMQVHFYPGKTPKGELDAALRRHSLNEPLFLIAMDFGLWVAAAFVFGIYTGLMGAQPHVIQFMFAVNLYTGLLTSIIAFFTLEYVRQKWVTPVLFPKGNLSATPGVFRIRIGTRLAAMLFGCNIIPFIAILGTLRQMKMAALSSSTTVSQYGTAIAVNALVFVGIGVWITLLVKGNLTRQLNHVIRVLNAIRQGNFDQKVPITSNDEIGYTGEVINQMTDGLKERDMIKEMFGRYVAHEVRDEILSGRIPLDGEVKEVTVLFCDLRDFTPLTASLPPKEVVAIINRYFRTMEEAIQAHQGLVLQFLGDEIEAVFGAPVSRQDHARLAVAAAQEMSKRMVQVNTELEAAGYAPLRHGIGIHSGEAVAANIGSPNRLSYALVGDTVNIASRLQGLNKVHSTEIILSGATKDRLNGDFPLISLPSTTLKGIVRSISLYTIRA
jgi:adenylate cyclase